MLCYRPIQRLSDVAVLI